MKTITKKLAARYMADLGRKTLESLPLARCCETFGLCMNTLQGSAERVEVTADFSELLQQVSTPTNKLERRALAKQATRPLMEQAQLLLKNAGFSTVMNEDNGFWKITITNFRPKA